MTKPPVCVTTVEANAKWGSQAELFPIINVFQILGEVLPHFCFICALNIYSTRELHICIHSKSTGNGLHVFSRISHIKTWRWILCNAFWKAHKYRITNCIFWQTLAGVQWAEKGACRKSLSPPSESWILILPLPQTWHMNGFSRAFPCSHAPCFLDSWTVTHSLHAKNWNSG